MNYCQLITKFSILRLKNLPPFGVEFARVCRLSQKSQWEKNRVKQSILHEAMTHSNKRKGFAQPGNRTPVSTVGGYYDTTTPAALYKRHISLFFYFYNILKFQPSWPWRIQRWRSDTTTMHSLFSLGYWRGRWFMQVQERTSGRRRNRSLETLILWCLQKKLLCMPQKYFRWERRSKVLMF